MSPTSTSSLRKILFTVLPFTLISVCAGLTIGLTFAPCYSAMCVEKYFPHAVRYHIALFYGLLAGIALFLYLRNSIALVRRISTLYLIARPIPLIGIRATSGGLLLCVWIIGLTFGSIGYWLPELNRYWTARGELVHWTSFMFRVVSTGVTGHWCDLWMGLVVLPVGRNSILVRVFQLQPSALLQAHKILAVGLAVFSLIHGLLYYSFLGAWVAAADVEEIMQQFNPDNPLVTWSEGEAKGIYTWFVLPTGAICGLIIIPLMAITALPILRRIDYNVFYYTHVLAAVLLMVVVCIHASTNFYFLLPGLFLWLGDWIWRLTHSLGRRVGATVENAGNGWYRIRIEGGTFPDSSETALEKAQQSMCSIPLVTYYLNFAEISKFQNHPFTAIDAVQTTSGPAFLFQKSPAHKNEKKRDKEWTWKLAALADDGTSRSKMSLKSRIEGPYSPPVPDIFSADRILLLVGGTGVTGAISITRWWISNFGGVSAPNKTLHLTWTVRHGNIAQLEEIEEIKLLSQKMSNVTLTIHISSERGRLSPVEEVEKFVTAQKESKGRYWVYVSGPAALMEDTETACVALQKAFCDKDKIGGRACLDWYVANYTI